ncbi:MAG: hypothetical protein M3N21_07185 [Actinomycetota bacterium]|nr:hypothetical protein [Actinomycetota bacterium]
MTDSSKGDNVNETEPRRQLPAASGLAVVVALAVVGFVLIGVTWAQVSELTNTAKQLPYLVSGGLTGLGMVVLAGAGLVVVTRAPDERQRTEQTAALVAALERIEAALDADAP